MGTKPAELPFCQHPVVVFVEEVEQCRRDFWQRQVHIVEKLACVVAVQVLSSTQGRHDKAVSNQARAHLCHDRRVRFDALPQLIWKEGKDSVFEFVFELSLDVVLGKFAQKLTMSE